MHSCTQQGVKANQFEMVQHIRILAKRFSLPPQLIAYCGSGEWSDAYWVIIDQERYVARLGPHLNDFMKDQAMGHYDPHTFSIPRVLLVESTPEAYLCLSEGVLGRAIETIQNPVRSLADRLFKCIDEYRIYDPMPVVVAGDWPQSIRDTQKSWPQHLLTIAD